MSVRSRKFLCRLALWATFWVPMVGFVMPILRRITSVDQAIPVGGVEATIFILSLIIVSWLSGGGIKKVAYWLEDHFYVILP